MHGQITSLSASHAAVRRRPAFARVTAAASFGFALVQLDVTIVNVALPRIAEALHSDVTGLQWLVDAYALAFAVLLLSGGLLADRLGAKRVYVAGLSGFALASLLCGAAPNAPLLIAARVLQGVAAAAMLPSSLTLLNHATADVPAQRAKAVGIWTASGAVTIAAGPIVGGLLLSLGDWRSLFVVNLPLCALGVWLTASLPADPTPPERRGFDVPGQLLAVIALASLTAAVIEAGPRGFSHPIIVAGFVLAALSGGAFVWVETRSRAPMLPLALFASASFTVAVLYGIAINATFYGCVFVLSLYLQRAHGYSALQTGLAYLPMMTACFGVNLLSGYWVAHAGVRWPLVIGALIDALGFAFLCRLAADTSYAAMLPAFLLIPSGMGTGVPAMTTTVLSSVERAAAGRAAGVLNAARQAAGAIGVAICGSLAGDAAAGIVSGLQRAAVGCSAALLIVAVLAHRYVHPPPR